MIDIKLPKYPYPPMNLKEAKECKKIIFWTMRMAELNYEFKLMKIYLKQLRELNPNNVNLGKMEHYLNLIEQLIKNLNYEQSN